MIECFVERKERQKVLMNNNNGTGIFGLDDNLGGGMNEGWWRIVDGEYRKDTSKCSLNVRERK